MKGGCRRFERRYVEDDKSSEFSGKQFGRGPEPLRAIRWEAVRLVRRKVDFGLEILI